MSILRHHNNSGRTILNEQLTSQHQWLQRLVGNWACEYECEISPGEPVEKTSGTETFRSLGDIWVIGEGIMNTGDCAGRTVMTLGFDTRKQQFVGSFITSLMTHLWPYRGQLDGSGRKLILDSEGPSFSDEGAMARYQDSIEFIDDNHRVLSSQVLLSSGEWQRFMTAHYYRTPSTQAGQ